MKESARQVRARRKPNGTGKITIHAPNNPIIVSPKTHRAKGQAIAPPAPRVEVKPEPWIVPPGFRPKPLITLGISRWEHGGTDLWSPKEPKS